MKLSNIVIFALILIVIAQKTKSSKWDKTDENATSYNPKFGAKVYQKKYLLTKTEYRFWIILNSYVKKYDLSICPKVRMEDFVQVKESDTKMRQRYRGYIKSRHVDFLLCDNQLNILAAIELDDKSHDTKNAKKVDTLKNDVCDAANIPLYRFKTNENYEPPIEKMLIELHISDTNNN